MHVILKSRQAVTIILLIHYIQHFYQRKTKMASPSLKDSDTISETSTLASTATTDFAPKPTTKHSGFIALQTLLETPEPGATISSSGAGETLVDSQAIIKRNKRRKIYFIIGLTTFVCCAVLAAILVVIFGPTRVAQG
jgi:hypothetical protein